MSATVPLMPPEQTIEADDPAPSGNIGDTPSANKGKNKTRDPVVLKPTSNASGNAGSARGNATLGEVEEGMFSCRSSRLGDIVRTTGICG